MLELSLAFAIVALTPPPVLQHLAFLRAPADPKRAVIDPREADEDFAVQGEYVGRVYSSCGMRRCGLQVVAQGGGAFEAVRFDGGLPGDGAITLPGEPMRGKRQAGQLVLEGAEGTVATWTGETFELVGGDLRGRLEKTVRRSPTLGLRPPPHAVVLFGPGQTARVDKLKLADDGTMLAGATTQMPVGDFTMHLEFRTPYMPYARGQGRGNSGIYIQRRYEVQILDSFGLKGEFNECGSLYRQTAPDLNMCLPPLSWQTYDIQFRAPRWDSAGNKTSNAELTVFHNGVAVHYHREVTGKTGAGQKEGPEPLPIYFQDHGNPVTFRNVWIVLETPSGTAIASQAGQCSLVPCSRSIPRRTFRWCGRFGGR